MSENIVAGMSIGGGKNENFFFCLLEYFPEQKRWFLTQLNQVKEEGFDDGDQAITQWVRESGLKKLVIDFPLSRPPCETCQLECPGSTKCHNETVTTVRKIMEALKAEDRAIYLNHPKTYENQRVEDNMVQINADEFEKNTDEHLLSKSFKRKLKKGFLPYWNRPLDLWVWMNYYDQLLNLFKISYDSFGNTSYMLMSRFKYLLRHIPADLNFFESDTKICLLELHRSGVISKNQLINFNDLELGIFTKMEILKEIEKKLGIFIYQKDLDVIAKNPRAFDSFILTIVGQRLLMDKIKSAPDWSGAKAANFVIPSF